MDLILDSEILDTLNTEGWILLEDFFDDAELAQVIAAASGNYPSEEEYYSDPDQYSWISNDPFGGLVQFPFSSISLNNLPTHPKVVSLAEQCLGTREIRLFRAGLQAKFAGAADYEQPLHYDYPNHTLVVPDRGRDPGGISLFLYLSDVTSDLGPTYFVPKSKAPPVNPSVTHFLRDPDATHSRKDYANAPELYEVEVPAAGPAGSLLVYHSDTLHRGSAMTAKAGIRLTMGFAYGGANPWEGFQSWPGLGEDLDMVDFVVQASPRQRELVGFPGVGDPYWTPETIAAVEARYVGIDLTAYGIS
ncbi:MAG: phytanoyl-CoA dioxygenase family protein [Gemmatimonadota bacterium]|nr:phytanoyl-CoA dioxygenase family protein [Gemmatimonadota bacterium]